MLIHNTTDNNGCVFDLFFYLEGEEKELKFYHIDAEEALRAAGLLDSQPVDGKYHMTEETIVALENEVVADIARHEADINSSKILPHELHKGKRPHFAKARSPLFRYYAIQSPIGSDNYPTPLAPHHDSVRFIRRFDTPTFVEEIGAEAWGYLEYDVGLLTEEMEAFQLVEAPKNNTRS